VLDDDLLLLPVLSVILKMYKYISLFSCIVILLFSVSNVEKCHRPICVHTLASPAYNAGSRKSVTWTLDPNRPRENGSRYNDILSCYESPRVPLLRGLLLEVLRYCGLACHYYTVGLLLVIYTISSYKQFLGYIVHI